MKTKTTPNYQQVLKLIRQLPEKEIESLATALQSEMTSKKTTSSLQAILLDAPTWTDDDLSIYQAARDGINKSRLA
ncbi:hypothetical protein [uncultured Imperialibacter sp.]|uniref:hypothetical protein n=1 Tax=uncultured Imperialibacter sp. TaxID=1672639 RepID=UPI0030D83F80|tara:strand:- start:567 stop:794 length:228 start_codon:yes stop_codon:yes gene_type:complete